MTRKFKTRKMMRHFQIAAGDFIEEQRRCALFIDMGLGKTISVLTWIRDALDDFKIGRVLVVGPPRVVRSTWPDEIREWEHTCNFTFTNIQGTPTARLKKLIAPSEVHLISHDLIPWLDGVLTDPDQPKALYDHDYDVVVIDESSRFKNGESKRSKSMQRITARAKYVIILTGTPASNGLQDLWAQIYLVDRGKRLGFTVTAFRERWFNPNWDGNGYRPRECAQAQITNQIEDICFTLREADYSDVPPRIDNFINIDFDADLMKRYKTFERESVLEIEEGENIRAVSAAALTTKLMQFSNGTVYDRDRNEKFIHSLKVEALKDIVEDSGGKPIFVAYNFKTDLKAILAAFPNAVVMGNNPQTIKDWNDGKIEMLVAHPKSAGHGLNLQHGGHIAVWYGLTYSLEDYMQLNKRLHRKGQTETTIIHHLICRGTIDETVMKVLQDKDNTQSALIDALKRIIHDVMES